MPARVAITGIGAISASGNNTAETLQNFSSGLRNGAPVTLFKTTLPYPVFQVKNFYPQNTDIMRSLELTFAATSEALAGAKLKNNFTNLRLGICLGTTVASQLNDTDYPQA